MFFLHEPLFTYTCVFESIKVYSYTDVFSYFPKNSSLIHSQFVKLLFSSPNFFFLIIFNSHTSSSNHKLWAYFVLMQITTYYTEAINDSAVEHWWGLEDNTAFYFWGLRVHPALNPFLTLLSLRCAACLHLGFLWLSLQLMLVVLALFCLHPS